MQAVTRWQAKLESVEPDVQRVMAEEREETALRKAEMEANKAQVGVLKCTEATSTCIVCAMFA